MSLSEARAACNSNRVGLQNFAIGCGTHVDDATHALTPSGEQARATRIAGDVAVRALIIGAGSAFFAHRVRVVPDQRDRLRC